MTKPFYLSKPIDEYVLANDVLNDFVWIKERIPTSIELLEIQQLKSIDHATMALSLSLKYSSEHGPFIEEISTHKIQKSTTDKKNILWGVIPAMFYKKHSEVGGGGEHIISVGKQLNLNIEQIQVGEKSGVLTNARMIKAWMDKNSNSSIGIISLSKGSLDFRYAWMYLFTKEDKARTYFWLNFSGLQNGTGLADVLLKTKWDDFIINLAQKILGMEKNLVQDCKSSFWAWREAFVFDSHVKVYSFFPLALSSHVQTTLVGRYKKLSKLGPNDGMTDSYRSIFWQGRVFPIWGADHFCRTSEMVSIVYKLFSYIIKNDL